MSLEYLKSYVKERIADGAIDEGDPEADEHTAALKSGLADITQLTEFHESVVEAFDRLDEHGQFGDGIDEVDEALKYVKRTYI